MSTFHSIWTVLLMLAFAGIVWWAFGARRKSRFEAAAHSVLERDELDAAAGGSDDKESPNG